MLGEGGVSSTVVRTEPSDRRERGLLQGQVILSSLAIAVLASLAALLLPDAWLASATQRTALQIMALGTLAQVAGSYPLGVLRKALRFKAIQGSQALGIVTGFFLFGAPVAWLVDPLLGLAVYWSSQQIVIATLNYFQARAESSRRRSGSGDCPTPTAPSH